MKKNRRLLFFNNLFFLYITFFSNNIKDNKVVNSSIIFPLKYVPNEKFQFSQNNNNNLKTPEEIMLHIYYKLLITEFEIGSPAKNISLLIQPNDDKFYITSLNPSKLSEEKSKFSNFMKFSEKDLYNELLSSSYEEGICKTKTHDIYHFSEICESKEKINFKINNKKISKLFQIKLVKNNDDNIPGVLGLLLNDPYYGTHSGFIDELKNENLIDNYYWCFNFIDISPLEKIIKGQLIFGALLHEVYPEKYSIDNYKSTQPYIAPSAFKSWKFRFDNIYINEEKKISFQKTIISISYEIYNIIGTNEFHYKIKSMFINQLMKEKKCFSSNFTQYIYIPSYMIFYYCDISVKDILYKNLNNISFVSIDLDNIFQITKDDLFYIKDKYIYLNIIFSTKDFGFWILGQMFLTKYNFMFNPNKKEIGFYKKIESNINNNNNNYDKNKYKEKKKNTFLNILLIIIICIIFTCIGLIIGRKIFGLRRKIIVNELIEEQNYEYKTNNDNNNNNINSKIIESNYKPIGNNNNNMFEMKKKYNE